MALRRPSLKTINLYNELVERQNKVRKTLIRLHKQAEETHGAGRLPALVIPKKARKVTERFFANLGAKALERFWADYANKKALFSGRNPLQKYISFTVVNGYRELWADQIGIDPATSKYSEEQIANSDMGKYMELYNMLFARGRELFFLALYNTGKIIQFKYIYQDMISGLGDKENSWRDQQTQLIMLYLAKSGRLKPKETKELYKQAYLEQEVAKQQVTTIKRSSDSPEDEDAKTYSGRNSQKTISKAEKSLERAKNKQK